LHGLDLDWKKVLNSALGFCWNMIGILGSMNGGNFWSSQANTNSQELFPHAVKQEYYFVIKVCDWKMVILHLLLSKYIM